MQYHHLHSNSPYYIVWFGVLLFVVAAVHHASELVALDGVTGPLVAVLLDGLPALGLAYAGYWLTDTELSAAGRWQVCKWCFVGAALFGAIMGLSLMVRALEGRAIGEPVFPLLLAVEAGAIAGLIAGYNTARARAEARRARTVSDALGFVNGLIRHDLRNDLNVIHGNAELLTTDGGSEATEGTPERASTIAEKADEALTRIETTGVVAETLTGETKLEPVDVAAITAELTTRIESTADVSVTTTLPDSAHVTANMGLRSVVDNLLENAVEHNDSDTPQVHVAVNPTGEMVQLTVADNGPGIPDEQKATVLDHRRGETRGNGLSLVQTLVEGYGGEVWIEDNDPRGARFIVALPRAAADEE